jgi:hypothetical protein
MDAQVSVRKSEDYVLWFSVIVLMSARKSNERRYIYYVK